MTIKMKLNVHGLKDKDGQVAVYFYDENGTVLKDKNDKYNTSGGDVATHDNIKPKYDNTEWSEFKLSIPYSELHLSGGAGTKSIKFKFIVWDQSTSPSKNILSTSLYNTSFYFNPAFLTVDGSVTDKTKHFSESGGRETYYVKTSDSSYETWGVPSWCSIENKTSSSFTLVCNRNTSTSSRSDYMKVKAAGKEIRIDITQDASSGPSAKIVSVSQEHNVSNGFSRGMNIKLKFETSGMLNKRVTATAWFYYADNTTKLNNGFGGQVNVSKSDTAPYEDTTFTMTLYLPYTNLRMMGSGSTTLTFDVVITDSSAGFSKEEAEKDDILTFESCMMAFDKDDFEKMFKGDVSFVANEIARRKSLMPLAVTLLYGVRTNDEGRQYQTVCTGYDMVLRKNANAKALSYLERQLTSAKQSGMYANTDYRVQELQEYTVEPTNLESAESSNEPSTMPWDD